MTGPRRRIPALLILALAGCSDSLPPIELAPSTPGSATTQGGEGQRPIRLNTVATVEQMFVEAQRSAGMGNLGGAASLLEDVVKREPSHRDALVMLAAIDQARANSLDRSQSAQPIRRSAEIMRQVRTKFNKLKSSEVDLLREALFNEALVSAAEGKTEKAIETLEEAIAAGFASLDLLKNNKELDPIRKEAKFQVLLKKVEDVAQAQAMARVKTLFGATKPFAFEFGLPDLEGKTVAARDFRGKVLIVDFWGTWCPPCRREIPLFIELQKAHQAEGLQVVGINYEQVPPEQVKATIAAFV
jgi:thiol-disulfide isomerase/thioredoxin